VEWEADERRKANEGADSHYPMATPDELAKRKATDAWLARVRDLQTQNAERMKRGQPPLPIPPHP
jgi:hypothetical protein